MVPTKQKRRVKIIKPRLQLKLVGIFVGLTALSVLLQSVLLADRLTELSTTIPAGGEYLIEVIPGIVLEILLLTFGVVLPLIFAVGVLVTHRIAGPVYRFEQHLASIARGEEVGTCRIRAGDELQELCDLINRAVETMKQRSRVEDAPAETVELRRAS